MASSQSFIQPQLRFRSNNRGRRLPPICCGKFGASSYIGCLRLKARSGLFKSIAGVVCDSKAPAIIIESSEGEEIDSLPDTTGGDGFGGRDGGGGDGGGGGGDNNYSNNNNEGEGGSDDSNNHRNSKMALSMSQKLTLGYAALVGVGGVMGYLKSGSQKSLLAGGLSALLLYYVYTELPSRPTFASSLGLGLSAALLGVMGSRYKKSGKIFPAGVVSIVSLVMTGGYLHGIMRSLH
ncbi:hypothetical protein L1049_023234 [Liquidambar formosana]|uniref:Uncharacterized protein n=1 Tax=Liquidambar formosana TaxID=63359 RepID=A0AAP0RDP9_LIQFO